MDAFTLAELLAAHKQAGKRYYEFLRFPSMSAGIYLLPAGGTDPQEPHTEDELYYIVQGEATLQRGSENIPVSAGSFVFVSANVEHRFHSIASDLLVVVFFAPAEYTNRP